MQEGRYIAGVQTQPEQNLTDYTVFPFTDLRYYNDMRPLLGTCFANATGLAITPEMMQQVDDCAPRICCYTPDDQVGPVPCQDTCTQTCTCSESLHSLPAACSSRLTAELSACLVCYLDQPEPDLLQCNTGQFSVCNCLLRIQCLDINLQQGASGAVSSRAISQHHTTTACQCIQCRVHT